MTKEDKDSFLKRTFSNNTGGYLDVSSKRKLWKEIGDRLGGRFKISLTKDNVIEVHRLIIPHKKWNLKISESDTRPLKFEIEFRTNNDYEVTIGPEDYVEKILKHLGKREIEIGNKEFDNYYLVKSNDEVRTFKFFSKEIIKLLLKHNVYSLSYTTNTNKHTSKLKSAVSRTIEEKLDFAELIYLHIKMIDKLEELNIIC